MTDTVEGLTEILEKATANKASNPHEAIRLLREAALGSAKVDVEAQKLKEDALAQLCAMYIRLGDANSLRQLLTDLRPTFQHIPKAKTARLVRSIIDSLSKIPDSLQLQLEVCLEQVQWARSEKRTFLRQRIELRLASLYLQTKDYPAALQLIGTLLTEVKRLDAKLLLLDIHLLESRVHHALRNIPKAKAALTAARTAANAIYIPPSLQAEIDMQAGIINAEEHDYKTAYSYYFEAFEAFSSLDDDRAAPCLKYMLLCKVMTEQADEVAAIVTTKAGLRHSSAGVNAMRDVAKAYRQRSLHLFQKCLDTCGEELVNDPVVASHLQRLYDTLMEHNLQRLIEPYSRVEITHVAKLIELERDLVEAKLSQMILDKKFQGTLDQGAGCLEVFDDEDEEAVYPAALKVFDSMGRVVDTLFQRSHKIVA